MNMKKAMSLLLVLVLCLSLCACGGSSEKKVLEEQLEGVSWLGQEWLDDSVMLITYYIFNEGTVSGAVDAYNGGTKNLPVTRVYGTYQIEDGAILITWTTYESQMLSITPVDRLSYTCEDGTLHLFCEGIGSDDGILPLSEKELERQILS